MTDQPAFPLPPRLSVHGEGSSLPSATLVANSDRAMIWELPSIENDIMVSLSPPRPGQELGQAVAYVRLKNAKESRQVTLPSRLFVQFTEQGSLVFQDEPGPFWMDLSLDGEAVAVRLSVARDHAEMQHALFSRRPEASFVQKAEEFSAGSPIRVLGEARWWGADLVSQLGSSVGKQRMEFGSYALDLGEQDWLCWKGGRWVKTAHPEMEKDLPIAKIHSILGTVLEWDVWDEAHTRLAVTQQPFQNPRLKPDEWVGSLRIRSDRQISCTLEKQSIVLRLNDWAVKENTHWKVLRKSEDKQALIEGQKSGELFVLEKIDSKQKCIKGKLFFANRAQMITIEASACNAKLDKRNSTPHRMRKGKTA